jgi:hypothetical protein
MVTHFLSPFDHCPPFAGVKHAKQLQDELPPESHYIRVVEEMVLEGDVDEGMAVPLDGLAQFRLVVCMTPEASRRLQKAQLVQSDIGFKRIAGYLEFELGGLEPTTRKSSLTSFQYFFTYHITDTFLTGVVYSRVYLNRQSALAHQKVFEAIDSIVLKDTGSPLQWRHIHATTLNEYVGILHWSADQHGGQAKGITAGYHS